MSTRIRLRTGLDPAYFEDLLPRSEIKEPVSDNTSYRARLMRRYYGLDDDHEQITERARQMAWVNVEAGHLRIRLKNGNEFRDYGDRMTCPPGPIHPSTAREIILSAKAKGWTAIEVTGTEVFKDELALQAYLNDIPCDHELSVNAQQRLEQIMKERESIEMPLLIGE